MALAYQEPGVRIQEILGNTFGPLVGAETNIALIGLTQGYRTATTAMTLTGTTAIPIPGFPANSSMSSTTPVVKNALSPEISYTVTTDFTVSTVNKTITRVSGGAITDGTQVVVTYQYVPDSYFFATRFFDLGSLQDTYGDAYNTDGSIKSVVSYAAGLAFENGAQSLVVQPLFTLTSAGDPASVRLQPSNAATAVDWQQTMFALRDIEDVNVLVPVVGQADPGSIDDSKMLTIFQHVQDHINYMKTEDVHRVMLVGEDATPSSNATGQTTTLRSHAATLKSRLAGSCAENTAFVSPGKFTRVSAVSGQDQLIGGQYVAAALSGMLAGRSVWQPTTRGVVSGIKQVNSFRSRQDKNLDGSAGLTVIENHRGIVRVRHAITLDDTNSARRELSVVRSKHFVVESIRRTLDEQIIGKVVADGDSAGVVATTVQNVLEAMRGRNALVSYRDIEARTLTLDPTTVEVRFSYRPPFPINYIDVKFSVDLTTGTETDNNVAT